MMKPNLPLMLLVLLFAMVQGNAQTQKSYSSSELLHQLKKLNTVGSVLYIAAHPDDENTRLIAYLANEKYLRTGYLSLTRGDGGQNLIGPEQGIELGMLRTQELMAARRIDGGEQFFTRAYDFGFSKTPKETFEKWNHDSILGDVVWVIRLFQPDIIITRFATDGSGGHGHHTASAMLAEEAFIAAADPTRFPEQLNAVKVWQARRLFWNVSTRFQNPNADMSPYIKLDVGGYNALLGKSYGEISAESRSMHKSQGFGSAMQRGEYFEYFKPINGDTVGLRNIFDGIDFSWKRVSELSLIGDSINRIIQSYNPEHPEFSSKRLLGIGIQLQNNPNLEYELEQLASFNQNVALYAGLYSEHIADKPNISKGDTLKISMNAISRMPIPFEVGAQLMTVYTDALNPINVNPSEKTNFKRAEQLIPNKLLELKRMAIPQIPFENKFFYSNGIVNNMYVPTDYLYRAMPEPHLSTSIIQQSIYNGYSFFRQGELKYKWTDPTKGEQMRPVIITPPVLISTDNDVFVFGDNQSKEIKVTLKSMRDSVSGELKIPVPQGWVIEPIGVGRGKLSAARDFRQAFSIARKGESETFTLKITPSETVGTTNMVFSVLMNGNSYDLGMKEIKYDHIPVQTRFIKAELKLVRLELKHRFKKIGYIPGAGDEVAVSLEQIGYEVVNLTNAMLASDDLSKYEAIITGVRAYNTNDQLSDYKKRLMDYIAKGGNLIVQYNTNSFAGPLKSNFSPYPFKVSRDRITDENATVTMNMPNHAVFNTPNKITAQDFEGWIQERSIYHGAEWDSNYVAPVTMNDPGEKPNQGALLISKYGKGHFVYTGFVFFRELPAGVPGAYRLMVNMIELKD